MFELNGEVYVVDRRKLVSALNKATAPKTFRTNDIYGYGNYDQVCLEKMTRFGWGHVCFMCELHKLDEMVTSILGAHYHMPLASVA